jgi:hypothetical protein
MKFYLLQFNGGLQYRHSMINHCDGHITLLNNDTDISLDLFNLFTYFDMPFG